MNDILIAIWLASAGAELEPGMSSSWTDAVEFQSGVPVEDS